MIRLSLSCLLHRGLLVLLRGKTSSAPFALRGIGRFVESRRHPAAQDAWPAQRRKQINQASVSRSPTFATMIFRVALPAMLQKTEPLP